MSEAAFPDVQTAGFHTDPEVSIQGYTYEKLLEYWTMIYTLGLLAGAAGEKAEQEAARQAVFDALEGVAEAAASAGIKIVARRISKTASKVIVRATNKAARGVPESGILLDVVIPDEKIDDTIKRQLLDEDNLGLGGTTRKEVEARIGEPAAPVNKPSAGKKGDGDKAVPKTKRDGNLAEAAAAQRLKKEGYTDVISLENKSGHGVDLIGRKPDGSLKVIEVKANGASLSDAQTNLGGPEFLRQRLDAASKRQGHWKSLPEGMEDKIDTLEQWLTSAPSTEYKVWNMKADADTGYTGPIREADWSYAPGKKPKRLSYREIDQLPEVAGDKTLPPATGPPKDSGS